MPPEMAIVALRYALGYLLQVVPCAVLCLLPFTHALKRSLKRLVVDAVLAISGTCIAFVVISLAIFDPHVDMRIFLSNILFLIMLAVLLPLFWNEVAASRSCKTFVFLMAMVYGCVLAVAASALRGALGFPGDTDARLYAEYSLVIFAVLDAVTLPLGCLLMRRVVLPWLEAGLDDVRWRRLCLFPAAVLVVVVGLYWMPRQLVSPPAEAALFASVLVVGIVVAVVCYLRIARDLERALAERDGLYEKVGTIERERDDLVDRVDELKRESANRIARSGDAREGAETVVFRTPSAVASFKMSDMRYLEVFGHKLVIHLSGGRVEQLNYSLSQARELLPQDRFLQCHRSYLVNKQAVRSLRRYEITLADGEVVPVSKQRYREVEEELGAR
mgnify:CR=1 FL=1